jgi:hypothetical protein
MAETVSVLIVAHSDGPCRILKHTVFASGFPQWLLGRNAQTTDGKDVRIDDDVVFHGCFKRPGIETEDVAGTDNGRPEGIVPPLEAGKLVFPLHAAVPEHGR